MPNVYLDTNQFVRVFERKVDALFPEFRRAVEQNDWKLVISEGLILEIFSGIAKGANRDAIRRGLDLAESLQPIWLAIAGLDIKELSECFLQFQLRQPFPRIDPFLRWPEFLATITRSREISVLIDLAFSGVSGAFDKLYETGRMTRNDNYWQTQLDASSVWFRQNIRDRDRRIATF